MKTLQAESHKDCFFPKKWPNGYQKIKILPGNTYKINVKKIAFGNKEHTTD